MGEKKRKLSETVKDLLDTLVDAVEGLLTPPPQPVPVRVRRPRMPVRRR